VANDPETGPVGEDPNIDSLHDRIAKVRADETARLEREHGPARIGTSMGIQVASTMVGYPLGGILIGLVLDNVFDTMPWITIGLMFTAFAGACVHVVRMTKNRAG
jgi:F0F1-type ATP synthase assembly protein I